MEPNLAKPRLRSHTGRDDESEEHRGHPGRAGFFFFSQFSHLSLPCFGWRSSSSNSPNHHTWGQTWSHTGREGESREHRGANLCGSSIPGATSPVPRAGRVPKSHQNSWPWLSSSPRSPKGSALSGVGLSAAQARAGIYTLC